MYDVVVIGGGQAGLAAGYYLQKHGLRYILLEAGEQTAGSWVNYYENLRLFSPVQYSSLPGLPFPLVNDTYPSRTEVIQYLNQYQQQFDIQVKTRSRVLKINKDNHSFKILTEDGSTYSANSVICATGPFNQPYIPQVEGIEQYTGNIVHSYHYKNSDSFRNQRVIVVGGGNSAVQIAIELSKVAVVSIATRSPITYMSQRLLRKDIHFWTRLIGLDTLPLGQWIKIKNKEPVIDLGEYKTAIEQKQTPNRLPMFKRLVEKGVEWEDGEIENVDSIIFATGYKPSFPYLNPLQAVDQEGYPIQKGGISTSVQGLYFVGLPWQRNHASATLRGVGPDAHYVIKYIRKEFS